MNRRNNQKHTLKKSREKYCCTRIEKQKSIFFFFEDKNTTTSKKSSRLVFVLVTVHFVSLSIQNQTLFFFHVVQLIGTSEANACKILNEIMRMCMFIKMLVPQQLAFIFKKIATITSSFKKQDSISNFRSFFFALRNKYNKLQYLLPYPY